MIGIGIARPGIGNSYAVVPPQLTSFTNGAMAVSNIVIAYNGHIAYPTIISEMKHPRDFPKALVLLESVTITFYVVVAVVIYYFAGQDVASPALGSASTLVRKIAFGIAIPTIIVAGVIMALIAAKNVYSHVWAKQPRVMSEKDLKARGSWCAIIAALWVIAWLIAAAIPVFSQLIALIGALFGTWFCLGFCAMLWLAMNWEVLTKRGDRRKLGWRKVGLAVVNVVILGMSATLVSSVTTTSMLRLC